MENDLSQQLDRQSTQQSLSSALLIHGPRALRLHLKQLVDVAIQKTRSTTDVFRVGFLRRTTTYLLLLLLTATDQMQFLSSLSSAVLSASTAALTGSNSIPGLAGFSLGDKVQSFEGKSIWTLYEGTKKVSRSISIDPDCPTCAPIVI